MGQPETVLSAGPRIRLDELVKRRLRGIIGFVFHSSIEFSTLVGCLSRVSTLYHHACYCSA